MQINTNLNFDDYMQAYKDIAGYFLQAPLVLVLCLAGSVLVTAIPFSLLPVKTGACVAVMWVCCALITTHYRTGSLQGIGQELKFQQRLMLPVIMLVMLISWVALMLQAWVEKFSAVSVSGAVANAFDITMIIGLTFGAVLVCKTQILPLVLAYFGRGLNIEKQSLEHIWLVLLRKPAGFLAFAPPGLLIPVGIMYQLDVMALFVGVATIYTNFICFIIFNIPQAPLQQAVGQQFQPTNS